MYFLNFASSRITRLFCLSSIFIVVFLLIFQPMPIHNSYAQGPSATNISSISQSDTQVNFNEQMKQLEESNDPTDIATLAYIWGYPLVITNRAVDFGTDPNTPPGVARGPLNTFTPVRNLINASFTDVVNPNVDTLYSRALIKLNDGPLVLEIPPIPDRYYTFQFMDAYSNNFMFIGSRTNVTSGGTYLISGPNWNGTVPSNMTEVKSPTNTMWLVNRILVNGTQDENNVNKIQDILNLYPLNNENQSSTSSSSVSAPVSPQPDKVPTTGPGIFDEISKDMASDPPYSYDSNIVAKFKTIGIGPNMKPSDTQNQTILNALKQGIIEGEKLIDEKVKHGTNLINGWTFNLKSGNFGTDYLLRAAIAKDSIAQNSPEEAVYSKAYVDGSGNPLKGSQKYVLHFDNDNLPPVKAFWSVTMYNSKSYFEDNPLNRYAIGDRTAGLKYNLDGSLDIYIQHDNPGKDRDSNWLPAPSDDFNLMLRMYIPEDIVLNGEYKIPPVQITR